MDPVSEAMRNRASGSDCGSMEYLPHTRAAGERVKESRERERVRRLGGGVEAAPDVAALARVGVDGVHAAHGADGGAVLRHVQVVAGLRELRWFVGVQHHDPHRRLVLEGTFLQVARVHEGVGHLHREGVGVAGLVIQQLPGVREEDKSQSGEGVCQWWANVIAIICTIMTEEL